MAEPHHSLEAKEAYVKVVHFPLLYTSQTLKCRVEHERATGRIQGISFMRGVKGINHFQFVDDTLFLGVATTIIAKRFKAVLDSFLNAYIGKVNNMGKVIYKVEMCQ
jgi:hypothetical protein